MGNGAGATGKALAAVEAAAAAAAALLSMPGPSLLSEPEIRSDVNSSGAGVQSSRTRSPLTKNEGR